MKTNNIKRQFGQYFTTTNPFKLMPFVEWFNSIPNNKTLKYIEPFAGENNIPNMIATTISQNLNWSCFDIDPKRINNYPNVCVQRKDMIESFPNGYDVAITNPPYLSKNSATRRGLQFPNTTYDDIYKLCLEIMLKNVDYVAAIIPETFIVSNIFQGRLSAVISLTCKMFDDTGCPVCLSMFNKDETEDFSIFRMNEFIGTYSSLMMGIINPKSNVKWKFNDKNGEVGIICIDNTKKPSIQFVFGNTISPSDIKVSSRAITRVSGLPSNVNIDTFLCHCNDILSKYRDETKDVFLASFKGLRQDGYYRRRLDFATAKYIMNKSIDELNGRGNQVD